MKLTGDARSIERRVTLLDNIYKIAYFQGPQQISQLEKDISFL